MEKQPWMKFFPVNWRADPALRLCSLAARGLWAEMICIMHESDPYGHLLVADLALTSKQLAAIVGADLKTTSRCLEELESMGVFSRTDEGVIYSRRMTRDHQKSSHYSALGKRGGNPLFGRGTVPKKQRVRRFRRSDSPEKAARILLKSNGKCHFCGAELNPDLYYIRHLVPVRDGGTNKEENLVATCKKRCDGTNAGTDIPTPTELMVGANSDPKPDPNVYMLEARKKEEREKENNILDSTRVAPREDQKKSLGLAETFLAALEIRDRLDIPPSLYGVFMRAEMWEIAGYQPALIAGITRKIMESRTKDAIPAISYFEKAFATGFAKQSQPLPTVNIPPSETINGRPATTGSLLAATDKLIENLAGFGESPSVCAGTGSPAVRAISPRRSQ